MNQFLRKFSIHFKGVFETVASKSIHKKELFGSGLFLFALILSFEGLAQTTVTYNGSGVFTVPAGVTSITVECWGGGGTGGGGTATNIKGGGGGAGGAYARSVLAVTPYTSFTVTVGGTRTGGNAAGLQGNPSWFSTTGTVYAEGGAGGAAANNGTVAGGTGSAAASIGDVTIAGGNGANGTTTVGGAGGNGANGGGNGGAQRTGAENDGNDGAAPGGGGGGGLILDNTNHSGGDGAAGRVVITYTIPGGSPTTYYSKTSGNWNTNTTWTTSPTHTGSNAGPPVAGDAAVIGTGHIVSTNNGNRSCLDLAINGSGALNISNNNNTVTVSGNFTMDGTSQIQGNSASRILNVGGNFTVPNTATDARISGQTVTIAGTTTVDGTLTLNTDTGVKTFTGAVTNSGSWTSTAVTTAGNLVLTNDLTSYGTFSAGGITFNGSTTQNISGPGTFSLINITLNKNGTNLLIKQNISVSGAINWSSDGLFVVDSYSNMTLGSGASITGPGNNRYIQLDGTSGLNSQLIKQYSNNLSQWRILFPVGTATGGYTPLDLTTGSGATLATNPTGGSSLAVKPVYSASTTGQLRRKFRLTVNGNNNNTTLTNARFYYNATSDVSGGDVLSAYNTIWFLNSNNGSWTNVTGTAPGGSGYFTTPGTAQPLSTGTYYYTIGSAAPQCELGDQNEYGANSWIGHVYDGANNFQSANHVGRFTEPQNFDESFGGDFNNFALEGAGCTVYTETYSVRFRMALNVTTCGVYPITIGGDDGVRLSVDGGVTWENESLYNDHSYAEVTQNIYLDAGINYLILEFYENATNNRVRFNMGAMTGVLVTGGKISGDQTLCQTSIDPGLINTISAARNCAGDTPTYQWQYSSTSDFSSDINDIALANSATYDPSSQPLGTRYYRRRAIVGGETVYSNIVTITADSPQGDQTTAGTNSWVGYVYDGVNNFTTNYLGYFNTAQTFDYSFCGDDCTEVINGCDFNTTTFTVRYRMSFTPATSQGYTFTIGADDGVRLSLDGGATYVLSDWSDHGYREVTSGVIDLFAGTTYNMVLDYYENGGGNRVRFAYSTGPLPVVWRSFSAKRISNDVSLTWETAQEINNDHFEIERSEDGRNFYTLGELEGAGNSMTPLAYQYLDKRVSYDERHYYRIKQVDFDGKYDYSAIAAIQATAESIRNYWVVYPNPFAADQALKVSQASSNSSSGNVSMVINSAIGQVVFQASGSLEELNWKLEKASASFGTGAYILWLTDGSHNEMFRVVRY